MKSVLPIDEINRLSETIRQSFTSDKKMDMEDIIDMMFDLFLLSYANGVEVTNQYLSSDWEPTLDDALEVVDAKIAGKTWRERVKDYYEKGGSADDLIRIVETEAHRDANTGALKSAKRAGATTKTWVTRLDDRVRETHDYLESVTVGIDDEFIAFDGDRAQAPGLFDLPENNVNCRCELLFG